MKKTLNFGHWNTRRFFLTLNFGDEANMPLFDHKYNAVALFFSVHTVLYSLVPYVALAQTYSQ